MLWIFNLEFCDVALHTNAIVTSVAQVLPHFQLIFSSKIWFFGIYLNFHWQKSLKNQYFILNSNLTK
jgi:hypothetical protein